MNQFWKRAGWLGLAIVALLASLGLQILMGVIAVLPASIMAGVEVGTQGITDPALIQEMVMERAMGAAAWGVLLYHVLSLPVFGLWYYFGCGKPKAVNPVRVFKPKCILATVLAGFGLCLVANGVAMLLRYLTPALFEQYLKLAEAAGMGENVVTIVAAVILAPIGEEILCRGIIFHYGRKMAAGIGSEKVSFWIANIVQALLFGIMHGNFVQGTYAFILGLGLGLLREKYNSLYPSMLCHFLINFLSTYVIDYLLGWVPDTLLSALLIFIIGAAISVAAIAADKKPQKDQLAA